MSGVIHHSTALWHVFQEDHLMKKTLTAIFVIATLAAGATTATAGGNNNNIINCWGCKFT